MRVVDTDGWPIVVGARVYVLPRAGIGGRKILSGFSGRVAEVREDERYDGGVAEVREVGSWSRHTVRATDCRVQAGKSRADAEDALALEAWRRRRVRMPGLTPRKK